MKYTSRYKLMNEHKIFLPVRDLKYLINTHLYYNREINIEIRNKNGSDAANRDK